MNECGTNKQPDGTSTGIGIKVDLSDLKKTINKIIDDYSNYTNAVELAQDFLNYCREHRSERFFQALCNWSSYNFIYGSYQLVDHERLEDTFYKEGK